MAQPPPKRNAVCWKLTEHVTQRQSVPGVRMRMQRSTIASRLLSSSGGCWSESAGTARLAPFCNGVGGGPPPAAAVAAIPADPGLRLLASAADIVVPCTVCGLTPAAAAACWDAAGASLVWVGTTRRADPITANLGDSKPAGASVAAGAAAATPFARPAPNAFTRCFVGVAAAVAAGALAGWSCTACGPAAPAAAAVLDGPCARTRRGVCSIIPPALG